MTKSSFTTDNIVDAPSISADQPVKAIAFYLPQFHPIPENDEWWGKGFTEWTNVVRSVPKFRGHVQPRFPTDLGFCDLRIADVRKAQADLARAHGVTAFCYYHYWFNGRRLLNRPLDEVLASGEPDFPFCICWANENWTRRWDGSAQQVLLAQEHSIADDEQHIRALLPTLADPRYLRVNGKPLVLIYRTELLPEPARTAEIWQREAVAHGLGELYLARVDSFSGGYDPRSIGFDAAVEFAPNWSILPKPRQQSIAGRIARKVLGVKPYWGDHSLYRYEDLVTHMLSQSVPDYPRFRGACPSWDNSPRRKANASIFEGATPALYEDWLRRLIAQRQEIGGELAPIFINAWNEWAEGAHLEPCSVHGRGFLEATRAATQVRVQG